MSDEKYPSRPLKLDEKAESARSDLPAFLSRPHGAPVYHGFRLVEDTRTDGWCFGAITEFEDSNGCGSGDGFVVAPDDSRAGIVWEVGEHEMQEILPPDEGRWGVYAVWFPRTVRSVDDMVFNFRRILPSLKKRYETLAEHKRAV